MNIAFTGSHCTGKTTLLHSVVEKYSNDDSFGYITKIAQKIIDKGYPLNTEANTDSYIHYINDQLIAERNMVNCKLFISDRTLLDPLAYALVNEKLPRPYVRDYLIDMIKNIWLLEKERYDLYIYFPVEYPMFFNGIRPSDEEYRMNIDKMIYQILNEYSVNYITMNGDVEERKRKIFEIIESDV